MTTLSYRPLFFAVFVLQVLTATTVMLSRFSPGATIVFLVMFVPAAWGTISRGRALSLRGYVPGNVAQLAQVGFVCAATYVWLQVFEQRGLFVAFGLTLLLARNTTLTVRRALYFDLAILLTIFYDAIGAEFLPYRWPLSIAFLLALLFALLADYTDRRLAYVKLGDSRQLEAILPAARNTAFATALVLALAAVIYVALPQPKALEKSLFPDEGPPSSWLGSLLSNNAPAMAAKDGGAAKGGGSGGNGNGGGNGGAAGRTGGSSGAGGETLDLGGGANGESVGGAAASEAGTGDGGGSVPIALLLMRADRPLYLRTHSFVLPSGATWSETPNVSIQKGNGPLVRKAARPGGVQQFFRVTRDIGDRVPVSLLLDNLGFAAPSMRVSQDLIVAVDRPIRAGTEYDAVSSVQYLGAHPSGSFEDEPEAEYLLLPQDLPARVSSLARKLVDGRSNASDKAAALEAHLHASYSAKSFRPQRGRDVTDQFLFDDRGGGSRQFAGALAVMLRTVGIPSRIVGGFRARRLNPLHDNYEVWRSDRHYWVEAYVGRGWVTYEPTPWATLPAQASPETAYEAAREYVRLAREPATDMLLAGEEPPQADELYLYRVLAWGWLRTYGALLMLSVIAVVAAAARWRWWSLPLRDAADRLRLRLAGRGDPLRVVRTSYGAIERMSARRSLGRGRSENHAEHLARVAAMRPHLAQPCAELAACFAAVRYGSAVDAAQAHAALGAARTIAELIDEKP